MMVTYNSRVVICMLYTISVTEIGDLFCLGFFGQLLRRAIYNHWTGLVDWTGGLNWWTGLVDWH